MKGREYAEALARMKEQIDRERALARPIAERLRHAYEGAWDRDMTPEWRTAGFVLELTRVASEALDNDLTAARSLAQLAVAAASALSPEIYPLVVLAQVEAAAWKELSTAHRDRSEYEEALMALDAADRCLWRVSSLAYDRATIELARASIYGLQGRAGEARELLTASLRVFADYGDKRRAAQVLLIRGNIEQRQGLFGNACDTYEEALDMLGDATDDFHTLGCIWNGLGQARTDLGHLGRAAEALQNALGIFSALEMRGEIARLECALGRVLVASGRCAEAQRLLAEGRRRFLELPMPEEAGLAGIDLAEALLATGEATSARALLETVRLEFQAAQLNERALVALAYLRDIVGSAPAKAPIRYVRKYVEALREQPTLAFVVPTDA